MPDVIYAEQIIHLLSICPWSLQVRNNVYIYVCVIFYRCTCTHTPCTMPGVLPIHSAVLRSFCKFLQFWSEITLSVDEIQLIWWISRFRVIYLSQLVQFLPSTSIASWLRQPFINTGACTPGTPLHSGQRVQVPQLLQFHEQFGEMCFLVSAWYSILLFVLSLCFKVRVSGSCMYPLWYRQQLREIGAGFRSPT